MFFLKKIFQLRDKSNPSGEKPFLEHLEDLRVCITRIVLSLLIATVLCFIFRNELMDIIRRPVTQVWERSESKALKSSKIPLEDWEKAKSIANEQVEGSARIINKLSVPYDKVVTEHNLAVAKLGTASRSDLKRKNIAN